MSEKLDTPKYPNGEYPNLSPNPNAHDGLVDNTAEKANTQVVNPGQVQEKRCLTVSEIIALIQKFAPQVVSGLDSLAPEYDSTATYKAGDMVIHEDALYQAKADISTAEEWNAEHWNEVDLVEALPKFLKGKFARVYTPAELTALSGEERLAVFKQGLFINGNWNGYVNPIVFPGILFNNAEYHSVLIGAKTGALSKLELVTFRITGTAISGSFVGLTIFKFDPGQSNFEIEGKIYPSYPDNTAIGQFICRKGTLQWYSPVAVTGITSGDDLAGVQDNLVNAMKDHLDVEINGHRCRFEYEETSGSSEYIIYSSLGENASSNLHVNIISLLKASPNTISFNQMDFTPTV